MLNKQILLAINYTMLYKIFHLGGPIKQVYKKEWRVTDPRWVVNDLLDVKRFKLNVEMFPFGHFVPILGLTLHVQVCDWSDFMLALFKSVKHYTLNASS